MKLLPHRCALVYGLVVTLLVSGLYADEVSELRTKLKENKVLSELNLAFGAVARAVEPSVVRIEVHAKPETTLQHGFRPSPGFRLPPGFPEEFRRFFELPGVPEPTPRGAPEDQYREYDVPERSGMGSGWVYDRKGHVVTNHHVIAGADTITVKLFDNREFSAKVVGSDPQTDVALLKIECEDLHPAELAVEPIEQGQIVFTFGSPLQFEFSVSQGIVSGKHRVMGILGPTGYENFIQTDAAINPGNSGGPLVNIRGEVVGMNTAIATNSGMFGGLGFAIPIEMARPILLSILESGTVSRGYLGVTIQDDPDLVKSFGYTGKGIVVADVLPEGAGAKAGLKRGDIITKLDGEPVESADELRRLIALRTPGTRVNATIIRDRKPLSLSIKLGEMPAEPGAQKSGAPGESGADSTGIATLRKLGFERLTTLTKDIAERFDLGETSGVLVERVRLNSVAAAHGIQPGTVIVSVMDTPVATVSRLETEMAKHDLKKGVRIVVVAGGARRYVFLKLPG